MGTGAGGMVVVGPQLPGALHSGADWYLGDHALLPLGLSLPTLHAVPSLPMLLPNGICFLFTGFYFLSSFFPSLSLCNFIFHLSFLLLLSFLPAFSFFSLYSSLLDLSFLLPFLLSFILYLILPSISLFYFFFPFLLLSSSLLLLMFFFSSFFLFVSFLLFFYHKTY